MSAPALIGVAAFRGAYTARHVQLGEAPEVLVPLLRRIWTDTFDRDTDAMAAALLARPWLQLAVNPKPRRWDQHPPVPGVGYPTATGHDTLWRGSLRENVDGPVEWLYLLHLNHRRLVVYEATVHGRWLRHSAHHLDPVEDLFVTAPALDDSGSEMTVCTVCGAADEIDHVEVPSLAGYGNDTITSCNRCGSLIATSPTLGDHLVRKPWPPPAPTTDGASGSTA
ncbi:hypothetical protein ACFFMR_29220 [Micromonospora andamanensis]|uniref:Uncharacterized protein n=1 Tax=Micromonospora andamanensis TaxID=1287068 RepID=A0ABQ4HS03_9ACTN|nr:hypothetical protein [Micromonospora andamanensis]GIJ08430.1 hypothetical protein Van01_16440 [Micromonospora andamanensis]